MLDPKPTERILDPACGPGGFLIHALNWVMEQYFAPRFRQDLSRKKLEYATARLYGIDFDTRLARVAKAMMLIAGDGRTNIYRVNTLDPREWTNRLDGLAAAIQESSFDVVLTNPPFAGNVGQPEILSWFDLSFRGNPTQNRRAARMSRDLLFIERCLRFLKPGGRMAIVLPQGTLNNVNMHYVRSWLMERARILAVIGLHANTFKPFTNTKTSVLFVQRLHDEEQIRSDYPIFMAVNTIGLKDNSGNYIRALDGEGQLILDQDGRGLVQHDFDQIADGFRAFASAQGLPFASP
jgi:type I restriction enzyme M protein